jgi:hypothetical protein
MSELAPENTITITGLDGSLNESLFKKISALLRQEGLVAVVRVEVAEKAHHYDSEDLGRHAPHEDPRHIVLNGAYSVNELDAISFKLRGGQ